MTTRSLAAVLEYFAAEILKLTGNAAVLKYLAANSQVVTMRSLAAVLEYLAAEILELTGCDNEKPRCRPRIPCC